MLLEKRLKQKERASFKTSKKFLFDIAQFPVERNLLVNLKVKHFI
jgi:hypothetical protein